MHTGKWWWAIQVCILRLFSSHYNLPSKQQLVDQQTPGGTIIPVIISSDKTQITLFRNKSAYPVYLTIGNLPKEFRSKPSQRSQILLAYLPTSKLEHIKNHAARRRTVTNVFHACMDRILSPLKEAGLSGLPMHTGDGRTFRTHPIYAAFSGDYPEQVLVTGIKSGQSVKSRVPPDEIGEEHNNYPLRDMATTLHILQLADSSPTEFTQACNEAGIKPIPHPFWKDLPYSNVFLSIVPDILHQLHQGVFKHLFTWLKETFDTLELDERCKKMPPNSNVRHFFKGISPLSRISGKEHTEIAKILLGLVVGLPLPNRLSSDRLLRTTKALLDFIYLAQLPIQSNTTLDALEDALHRFHINKSIFVDLGVRANFQIPKLEFLREYRRCIQLFGTPDNFNTEYTERLHIDFAKDAYAASNHKDEYPQMTMWLLRKEKVNQHDKYIRWRLAGSPPIAGLNPLKPILPTHLKMTKFPSVKSAHFDTIIAAYHAMWFHKALARYIEHHNSPTLTRRQLEAAASEYEFNFQTVRIYHHAKIWGSDFARYRHSANEYDVVHATPSRSSARGREVPGRFDAVLISDGTGGPIGVKGE